MHPSQLRPLAVALAAVILGSACAAVAGPSAPSPSGFRTERVVVFKDGYALVVKRAQVRTDADGRVVTDQVPDAAVLGSFWAWAEGGPKLRSMQAEWLEEARDERVPTACADPGALLRANPARQVTVELEGTQLTGTVVKVDEPRPTVGPTDFGTIAWQAPSIVALAVPEKGTVVLRPADVRRVWGPKLALGCDTAQTVVDRKKRLTLDFGKAQAAKSVSVNLIYFTPGLRWIPTYRLDSAKAAQGELSLQAELLNELEDLRGAAVDLVVGVPNFRFREVASPLSLERVMRNALAEAAPHLMGMAGQLSNAIFAQKSGEWRGSTFEVDEEGALALGDGEDLHVYPLGALDLRKGARAVVPLWTEKAKLKDVYTLDVLMRRDAHNQDTVQYGRRYGEHGSWSPLKLARAQVWHQVSLKNPGERPWTTGAVLVMKGFVPQAQELLPYTPSGMEAQVPITVAVDVRAMHDEVELERKQDALTHNGNRHTLIRKRGTLTLYNPRSVATPMNIRLQTGGKVEKANGGGEIKVDDFRPEDWGGGISAALNNHSQVDWDLTLRPGEKRTLTYEVAFYR